MTPELASAIVKATLPAVQNEYEITRRVLAAVPDDQGDYKPHEKNMSALELTQHIAFVEKWFLESILKGDFTLSDDGEISKTAPASKVVEAYERTIPGLIKAVGELPAEHLAKTAQFFTFNLPLVNYLHFLMNHTIHHRGQLSVYLRPMGAKVPSIYGGSADEPLMAAEQSA